MAEISSSLMEARKSPDFKGVDINSRFGLMLIGHDAIHLDVTEYVIASVLDRLKENLPSVELAGVIVLPKITENQVKKIYPDFEGNFLDAFTRVFGENESVLVVFKQTNMGEDEYSFVDEINKAKGKIERHKPIGGDTGWGDSIRGAIPLPGDRARYEEADRKIDDGELLSEDCVKLTHHLFHSADNERELAGLYVLIDEKSKRKIFGNKTKTYNKWAQQKVAGKNN